MFELVRTRNTAFVNEEIRFCRSRRFIGDLPYELTGVIHPDEFRQSIDNINYARRTRFWGRILNFVILACSIIGLILIFVGIGMIWIGNIVLWVALVGSGFLLLLFGLCIGSCLGIFVSWSKESRMKEAIAAESIKYSTRLPTPTRWRLHQYQFLVSTTRGTHNQNFYSIIIEIGNNINEEMIHHKLNMEPASYVGQQKGSDSSIPPNLIEHESF